MKLDMYTFISRYGDTYEYHGDTVAYVEGFVGQNFQYGMCIEIERDPASWEQTWDCQQIDVTVPLVGDVD